MNKKYNMLFFGCVLLSGCASQTGWTPTVDTYRDPNGYRVGQDQQECSRLAESASGGALGETAKGAGIGGLVGAAGGAALGAIMGSPGTGAAVGATVGVFGGGAYNGMSSDSAYKRAFSSCMRNRGHTTLN